MALDTTRTIKQSTPTEAVAGWLRWAYVLTADGDAQNDDGVIESPFDVPGFLPIPTDQGIEFDLNELGATPLCREIHEGGRILLASKGFARLDILPLFSTPAATAECQYWGFDFVNPEESERADVPDLIRPSKFVPYGLGVPYLLPRDLTNNPASVTHTALNDRGKYTLSSSGVLYPSPQQGDVWYAGAREIFEVSGLWAFFPWVNTLSAGSLILLARVL